MPQTQDAERVAQQPNEPAEGGRTLRDELVAQLGDASTATVAELTDFLRGRRAKDVAHQENLDRIFAHLKARSHKFISQLARHLTSFGAFDVDAPVRNGNGNGHRHD